jgi:exopolysaccharide production protein ExoQ
MATLTILLALGLFIYGLKWDRRQDLSASADLWWPTLWAMRCGSRSIDYWIGGGEAGRWDPVFLSFLILGGIHVLRKRRAAWGEITRNNLSIFVFYAYIAASVLWSAYVENPLVKIVRPVGDLIMALVVVTERNPRIALLTVFRRAVLLLIPMSIVLAKWYPELGRQTSKHWASDTWIGVATHKNPLGQLVFLAIIVFVWTLKEAKRAGRSLFSDWLPWCYLGMCALLFYGTGHANSRSSTSIMVTIFGLGLFWFVGHFRTNPRAVIRSLVMAGLLIGGVSMALEVMGTSLQAVVAGIQGKAPTLSDRTYLWADVLRIAGHDHPWLGAGYGGFFNSTLYERLSPEVNNSPGQAHNGYLETYANLGIIGVVLLAWVLLSAVRSSGRTIRADFEYGRWRIVLLFSVMLMNYAEATFPRGTHLWWFGFLVVALYAQPWVYWPGKKKRAAVSVDTGALGATASAPRPQAVPA